MMKKFVLVPALALALGAGAALAEEDSKKIEDIAFTFEGPFGTYDKLQLQRGLQIYTESCAACHGLNYVPVRTLADEGGPALPADQVRAYAETILPPIIERDSGEEGSDHGCCAPFFSRMALAMPQIAIAAQKPSSTRLGQLVWTSRLTVSSAAPIRLVPCRM